MKIYNKKKKEEESYFNHADIRLYITIPYRLYLLGLF